MIKYTYNISDKKVYCMTYYAGKTIKGIAKCDPEDTFNEQSGKDLSKARCDVKLTKKKLDRCNKRVLLAAAELEAAQKRYNNALKYQDEALVTYMNARDSLEELTKALNQVD